jgi:beta-1,4-mannosyl-glycoprotein beta-1,4-N-acetylglucosaminyltransferase
MAVYDCMHYWIENDLLEIRFNEHWDHVDKFVIVEAGETHTGLKKPFNFDHERFKPYMDKIVYRKFDSFDQAMIDYPHLVDEFVTMDRGTQQSSADWGRDHFQCNFVLQALLDIGAQDDDIVYVSCPDELLRAGTFETVKAHLEPITDHGNMPIIMFKYMTYGYKFNLLHKSWEESDSSGMVSKLSTYKKRLPATLRDQRICTHLINNAGWHFTFMDQNGGEDILAKQRAWAHSRDYDPNHTKLKFDSSTREEALARFLADYKLVKVDTAPGLQPQYILDNFEKFKNYFSE